MYNIKSRPTNRVGKVKLSIIAALIVTLTLGALMVAVLRNGEAMLQTQIWQAKANEINTTVNQVIDGELSTRDELQQDTEQQGLLQEYIEYCNNAIVLTLPDQLSNLLDEQVGEYIETQISELNVVISQVIQELANIDTQQALSNLTDENLLSDRSLTRGEFRLEAVWLALAIDGVFFVVSAGIAAAKAMTWLTGNRPVINIIKGAIGGIFNFLRNLLPEAAGLINGMMTAFNGSDPNTWLRWTSIGGIVAGILDWTDSDKKLDGWIVYR